MEDPHEDYWKTRDYSQSFESNSKLGWLWRKGLSLGKKMVMTGIVISSAPLILPPLVALSALGFALSMPAGFVFLTYACNEKLMNILLPMRSPPSLLEYVTMSSSKESGVDEDDVGKGYEEGEGIEMEERDLEEDTRKGVEEGISEMDESGQVPVYKDEQDTRKTQKEGANEGFVEKVEEQSLNSNVIPETREEISEAHDTSLMESKRDELPVGSLQEVVLSTEVSGENENIVEQVVVEVAFVPPSDVKEEGELRKETTALIEQMKDEGKDDHKRQDSGSNETSKESEGKEGIPIKDTAQDKENRNQEPTRGSDKVTLDEENIWVKIHTMRTIVGYKTAPRSSCLEELEALFVFTGVEPPASTKDPGDLADINHKLQFLMSIIGVK